MHHPDYDGVRNKTIFVGNDGGIQKTDDITTVSLTDGWINLANNLGFSQFYRGATASDGSVIVGGTHDNSHLRYKIADGPQGWFQSFTGDGGFAAVHATNPDIIYGSTQYLSIRKSTDGGETYSSEITGMEDDVGKSNGRAAFIAPFDISQSNPNVLVAGSTRIWRTTNGAGLWNKIRDPVNHDTNANIDSAKCTIVAIGPTSSQYIWAGYAGGHLAYTTDAGNTWIRVDKNGSGLPDRTISDIAIDPSAPNRVWVSLGGFESDSIWMTDDFGQSWISRTGSGFFTLPAVHVNAITVHPYNPDWVYIGTVLGVFSTEDGGENWNVWPAISSEGHDGPVNVEVNDLFWYEDFLVAATFGRGMYRTRPSIIFVDASNPAAGNGTLLNPYQTINQAVAVAVPGSTIYIKSGTYNNAPITIQERVYIITEGSNVLVQ